MLISFSIHFLTAFSQINEGFSHLFTGYVGFAGGDAFCFSNEH